MRITAESLPWRQPFFPPLHFQLLFLSGKGVRYSVLRLSVLMPINQASFIVSDAVWKIIGRKDINHNFYLHQ